MHSWRVGQMPVSALRAWYMKDMKLTSFIMATVNCKDKRTGHVVQLNIKSIDQRSAVRKYGGRVCKCLTILSNFLSNFVSLITVFSL